MIFEKKQLAMTQATTREEWQLAQKQPEPAPKTHGERAFLEYSPAQYVRLKEQHGGEGQLHVRVGGDQGLTAGKWQIDFSHHVDNVIDDLFVADINHHPLVTVKDDIDIAAQHVTELVVDFDNIWKNWFSLEHCRQTF